MSAANSSTSSTGRAIPHDAAIERRHYRQRGADRLPGTRGGVFRQKINDADRILATILYHRKRVPLEAGKRAGLLGRRRVLDSTPLYGAVAMMDAVMLIRSAIRGLLRACDGELGGELRGAAPR
jgi:hypothetical protein